MQPACAVVPQQRSRRRPASNSEGSAADADQLTAAVPGLPSRDLEKQLWAKGFKLVAGLFASLNSIALQMS